jgi:hypothetical protein
VKTLLIDIETAPALAYIWNLKTRYVPLTQVAEDPYILCFSAGWLGEDHHYFSSVWEHGEEGMVQAAWDLLDEADAVIHYNGNSFDIPTLNTEFLRYRLGPPQPAHHIDLYTTVSKKFRVLSKSMKNMLKILSLDNKLEHKGMELWTGCMAGNKDDQKVMTEYNLQDINVLEPFYKELLPWIDNHPNMALWMDESSEPLCKNCGSTNLRFKGYKRTSVLSYKQYQCQDCLTWQRARNAEERGPNRRSDVLR